MNIFLIISSKLDITLVAYNPLQRYGKSRIRRYALLKGTRSLLKVDVCTLFIDGSNTKT